MTNLLWVLCTVYRVGLLSPPSTTMYREICRISAYWILTRSLLDFLITDFPLDFPRPWPDSRFTHQESIRLAVTRPLALSGSSMFQRTYTGQSTYPLLTIPRWVFLFTARLRYYNLLWHCVTSWKIRSVWKSQLNSCRGSLSLATYSLGQLQRVLHRPCQFCLAQLYGQDKYDSRYSFWISSSTTQRNRSRSKRHDNGPSWRESTFMRLLAYSVYPSNNAEIVISQPPARFSSTHKKTSNISTMWCYPGSGTFVRDHKKTINPPHQFRYSPLQAHRRCWTKQLGECRSSACILCIRKSRSCLVDLVGI